MTITCEVCGTANPDGTTYCEGCGVELTTKAAAPAPATPLGTATPAPAPTEEPATAPPEAAPAPASEVSPTPADASPVEASPAPALADATPPAPGADAAPPATPTEAPVAVPVPADPGPADPTPAEAQPPVVAAPPAPAETAAAAAGGAARLGIKKYGAATGEFIPLAGERLVVGRFDASTGPVDIDLTGLGGQEHISRRHAELYLEGGTWKVRDLGSTNGVYIKRRGEAAFSPRLTEPAALADGDEIAFGNLMLSFHQG